MGRADAGEWRRPCAGPPAPRRLRRSRSRRVGACSYTSRDVAAARRRGGRVVDALRRRRHARSTRSTPRRTAQVVPLERDPDARARRGDRHRGRALLPPQRRRPAGDPAGRPRERRGRRGRAGRLDDHPAVREAGAARGRLADASSARSQEAALALQLERHYTQGPHPRAVPQRHLLRERRLRRRGGRRTSTSASRSRDLTARRGARSSPGSSSARAPPTPTTSPSRAIARRDLVLERMLDQRLRSPTPTSTRRSAEPLTLALGDGARPPSATRRRTSSRR